MTLKLVMLMTFKYNKQLVELRFKNGIEVRSGDDCPPPMEQFSELQLPQALENLLLQRYAVSFPSNLSGVYNLIHSADPPPRAIWGGDPHHPASPPPTALLGGDPHPPPPPPFRVFTHFFLYAGPHRSTDAGDSLYSEWKRCHCSCRNR